MSHLCNVHSIFFYQHFLYRPIIKSVNVLQLPIPRKEVSRMLPTSGCSSWHSTIQLHHLCKMIFISGVVPASFWLKKEVSSGQFEDHACKGPHVCRSIVLCAQNDLKKRRINKIKLDGKSGKFQF